MALRPRVGRARRSAVAFAAAYAPFAGGGKRSSSISARRRPVKRFLPRWRTAARSAARPPPRARGRRRRLALVELAESAVDAVVAAPPAQIEVDHADVTGVHASTRARSSPVAPRRASVHTGVQPVLSGLPFTCRRTFLWVEEVDGGGLRREEGRRVADVGPRGVRTRTSRPACTSAAAAICRSASARCRCRCNWSAPRPRSPPCRWPSARRARSDGRTRRRRGSTRRSACCASPPCANSRPPRESQSRRR